MHAMSQLKSDRARVRSDRLSSHLFLLLLFCFVALLPSLVLVPRAAASTWEKYYSWDYNEEGISIVQTPDGGFVIAGTTHSFGPGAPDLGNPYLMKLDSDGNMLWFQAYGTPLDEYMHSLALTPDGGFITCGLQSSSDFTSSTFYVIKTDGQGQLQWERTYGPTGYQSCAFSITPVRAGGYAIAGDTSSYYDQQPGEVLIIRTDMTGQLMWQRKYTDLRYSDAGWTIQETPEGGFMVGVSLVGGEFRDRKIALLRLNYLGMKKWIRYFDPYNYASCTSAMLTQDGGCIVGGCTVPSNSYYADACLIKTDSQGNKEWFFRYGGESSEIINSVRQISDGSYIACGCFGEPGYQNLLLLHVDAAGRLLWTRSYGGRFGDFGYSIIETSDGGFAMTGIESSWGPGTGIYVVKTDRNGNLRADMNADTPIRPLLDGSSSIHVGPSRITVTPNPFVSFSTVPGKGREVFSVYDVIGRRVGRYPGERIGPDLAPGVYILRREGADDSATRIVKIR